MSKTAEKGKPKTAENSGKKHLYQKILAVMKAVPYVLKDTQIAYKSVKYSAVTAEEFVPIVREAFEKNKLAMFPIQQDISHEGYITTVNTVFKLVDADSGEYELIASSGQGYDTQDKGAGKAMTYCQKYAFKQAFIIASTDDPDKVASSKIDDDEAKTLGPMQVVDNLKQNRYNREAVLEVFKLYHKDEKKAAEEMSLWTGLPSKEDQILALENIAKQIEKGNGKDNKDKFEIKK